ncbi:ABC transporter substrate-binding protein [Enemella sp. A6]|uniref:ABC transporter substrate-binding protein n=1 Tax=Enemella sp. A6 TaxID=3440152 RepID=UPI003EC0208E
MFSTRFARGAAVIAAVALTLSACARGQEGGDDTDSDQTADNPVQAGFFPQDGDPGEPVKGGTLTYADLVEGRSLDPTKVIPTGSSGGTQLVAIYDQLVRYDAASGEYQPRMAENVEPNDDYTEWTITLRENVKFSDGTPVDADAVIGSMNHYMQSKAFDVSTIGPLWNGVEKVDERTVVVKLKKPWAVFWSTLARGIGFIMAPAAIASDEQNFKPIGAGAFTLEEYSPGEQLVLKANPNHWDGAPYLDKVRFVWLGADRTKFEAYESGDVHATHVNDAVLIDELATKDLPRFTSVQNNGAVIMINQADGNPGKYLQVRKAFAHAIDPKVIADRSLQGKGYYGKTMFAPISKWYDDGVEVNDYDPEEAKRLLEEAKAEGYDGKVTLSATTGSPEREQTFLTLKAQLEAVGFEVETDLVRNLADWVSRIYVERKYSVASVGLGLVDNDPFQNLYSAYTTNGSSNVTNASDPEMDKLVDELRAIPLDDEEAMKEQLRKIENRVQEQAPIITFRYTTPTILWGENVHGLVGLNEVMVDFGKAWIKK